MVIEKFKAKLEMDHKEYSTMIDIINYAIMKKEDNIQYLKNRAEKDEKITSEMIEYQCRTVEKWKNIRELFDC